VASRLKHPANAHVNVCVFCSSSSDLKEEYTRPAKRLAKLIAERRYTLVWGGSETGLMKTVADTAQASGARLVGVSMKLLEHLARKNVDEMIVERSLGERKTTMVSRSDAVVVLVGGIGTLDEFMHTLELKRHGAHMKPIVVLNTEGFYDNLRAQFRRMNDEGFLSMPVDRMVFFAKTPEQAIRYVDAALLKKTQNKGI
jgi:hypothetical protein